MVKNTVILTVMFSTLFSISFISVTKKSTNQNAINKIEVMEKDQEIVNVAFVYIKDGKEAQFEEYKRKGAALLEQYGGKLERIIKPQKLVKGTIELPDEIHFARYPSIEVFDQLNADPVFIKLRKELAMSSIEKIQVFPSKNTDFKYTQEHGDLTKTYGVALVYFKEGKHYEKQFADYHEDACKIIPEFGAHFERFIAPFSQKGNLNKPDEIHRFYFDSPDGMKQMGSDKRMQALFPKRDESLKDLVFIIGQAIL